MDDQVRWWAGHQGFTRHRERASGEEHHKNGAHTSEVLTAFKSTDDCWPPTSCVRRAGCTVRRVGLENHVPGRTGRPTPRVENRIGDCAERISTRLQAD